MNVHSIKRSKEFKRNRKPLYPPKATYCESYAKEVFANTMGEQIQVLKAESSLEFQRQNSPLSCGGQSRPSLSCWINCVGYHVYEFFCPSDRLLSFIFRNYVHFFVDYPMSFLSHAIHHQYHPIAQIGPNHHSEKLDDGAKCLDQPIFDREKEQSKTLQNPNS
jgi:hypothetical protein